MEARLVPSRGRTSRALRLITFLGWRGRERAIVCLLYADVSLWLWCSFLALTATGAKGAKEGLKAEVETVSKFWDDSQDQPKLSAQGSTLSQKFSLHPFFFDKLSLYILHTL